MITKLRNIKYKMWEYFYHSAPIFVCLNPFKPLYTYLKACFVFKRPDVVIHKLHDEFHYTDYFYVPLNMPSDNKILYIDCADINYKYKNGDLRFECVPYIVIMWKWFGKLYKYVIGFESQKLRQCYSKVHDTNLTYYERDNDFYWEAILEYVYQKHPILEVYDNNVGHCSNGQIYDIIPFLRNDARNNVIYYINSKYEKSRYKRNSRSNNI